MLQQVGHMYFCTVGYTIQGKILAVIFTTRQASVANADGLKEYEKSGYGLFTNALNLLTEKSRLGGFLFV
jgi:hypothetical protein